MKIMPVWPISLSATVVRALLNQGPPQPNAQQGTPPSNAPQGTAQPNGSTGSPKFAPQRIY